MEAEKFSLLEDVKSIKVGNEMSVTLSMGIGYVGNDYTKTMNIPVWPSIWLLAVAEIRSL